MVYRQGMVEGGTKGRCGSGGVDARPASSCRESSNPAASQGSAVRKSRGLRALGEDEWWRVASLTEQTDVRTWGIRAFAEKYRYRYYDVLFCRNTLAMWLMGHCGLRVNEVLLLPWSSVWGCDGALGACMVTESVGKGQKARQVPMDRFTRGAVTRLRVSLRDGKEGRMGGRPWGVGRAWRPGGVRRIRLVCAEMGNAAIQRPIRPHEFRHTFATRVGRRAQLVVVQQLLGHESLSSTQRYLDVTWEDKLDAVKALESPVPKQIPGKREAPHGRASPAADRAMAETRSPSPDQG